MAQNPSPNNNLRGRQEGPRTRIRKQNQQRVDEHHAMLAGAFVRPDPPRWVRDRRFRPVVTAARRAVPLPISRLLREGIKRLNINDKREPIDFEAFAKLRAEFTERFAHYRVGRYGNDTHEVPEEVSRLWLRPEALLPRQAQLLRRRYKLKRRDDIAPGRGYTDQDKNGVRIAVDKVMPEFKPSPMTWKRFLGAGGMGLVALFQAKNRQHETKDVIVKIPLDAGDMEQVLLDEKKYYKVEASASFYTLGCLLTMISGSIKEHNIWCSSSTSERSSGQTSNLTRSSYYLTITHSYFSNTPSLTTSKSV